MKKRIKFIAAAGMILAVIMMLCSCKSLDKKKWNQAVYTKQGFINTVEFRGKTYALYGGGTVYGNLNDNYSVILSDTGEGTLTEPDVPVLLSDARGERIYFNDTKDEAPLFFAVNYSEGSYDPRTRYYYEMDRASEFENMIKEVKMDHFFFYLTGWSEETHEYFAERKLLSDKATDAIFKTINRPFNPKTDMLDPTPIADLSAEYFEPAYCDKNMVFTNDQSIQVVRTNGNTRKYYIAYQKDPVAGYESNGAFSDAEWKLVDPSAGKAMEDLFTEFKECTGTFYES